MKLHNTYILILSFILLAVSCAAQNADSVYKASLINGIGAIPVPATSDTKLLLPEVPQGFILHLVGSDNEQVINQRGDIYTPLVSKTVSLYLQLTGGDLSQPLDVTGRQVTVPGKYPDGGINPRPDVIPALREWYGYEGMFDLKKGARIVVDSACETIHEAAGIFRNDLLLLTGLNFPVKTGSPRAGDIFLTLSAESSELGEEGYYLTVDNYITVSAPEYRGLFHGTRTLLQILEQDAGHARIPKGIARDYPKYEIRGFMLDVGRKFFSMDFLRDYVKLMSYYKMNEFQIHLSDNGFKEYFNNDWDSTYAGFRLENTTYPGLTSKDGSYTKAEFMDLQRFANSYGVNIVPELDVPAHCLAYSHAIPEVGSRRYGLDHLDLNNPLTYRVVENVLKEYLQGPDPVFMSKTVHIGTDEYNRREAEPFRAFTDHFIRYVQSFGKDARIWGSLTHAKGETPVTSANVTMNAWYNGYADPVEMKRLGYKLVSTPDGYLYIVPAAGYYHDYLALEMLYNRWEPLLVGNVAFAPGDPAIIGGMFAAWNDIVGNGITMKDVNDRVFPAMQVLAQKMWTGAEEGGAYGSFAEVCKNVGEGPGVNIRGKLPAGANRLVGTCDFEKPDRRSVNVRTAEGYSGNALWLCGAESYASLPFVEIGYDYTVSFRVNAGVNAPGAVLFSSPNASVIITDNGKLGFCRENYTDDFDYVLPEGRWTHIVVTGTARGTALYVNGALYKRLYDNVIHYEGLEKTNKKIQTLFFPLQTVGDRQNAFTGGIDELRIFNTVLSDSEINKLFNP